MAVEGSPGPVEPKSVVVKDRSVVDGSDVVSSLGRCDRGDSAGCRAVAHIPMASRSEALLGAFWSATQSGHVVLRVAVELARLLLADFDTVGVRGS